MEKQLIWDKIGKICIYALFGLVPVFFLPFTAFPVIENKTILAGMLVFVAFGAWLANTLNTGRLVLPKTRLWFALVALLAIGGISTFLSQSRQLSLWGDLGSIDNYFNFAIYGLALFLTPAFLRETKELMRALLFFSLSVFLTAVYSLFQFFGIFLVPLDFTKQNSFNPIGTVQALAIFLGSGLVMIVALVTSFKLSSALKIPFAIGAAVLALILILVNFNFVWLGILLASALVVSWQIMHSRKGGEGEGASGMLVPKFGLPLVLMVIVAILFFVQPPISRIVSLPAEVRPSLSATLDIARSSLSSSVPHAIFGSGPSTFLYEYLMHRSTALNATGFWGVRFSQGFATMPTLLITTGFLGIAAIIFFFGFFILVGFRGVAGLARKKSPAERIALISFVSFLFLFLSWFFYPVNFTILLFTFLFAGMVLTALTIGGAMETLEFSILKTPQRTFLGSLLIIILIVGVIVGIYWQGQKYIASVFHTIGVQEYNKNRDIDAAMKHVGLAVNLDQTRDAYWRTFAQLLSLRAQEVIQNKNLDAAELQRRYQVILQSLIQAGQRATQINSRDPLNWRQLASIYEDNIAIVGGADRFAIENYEKAAGLNPQNPAEYLNVAQAYVRAADTVQGQIARASQGKDAQAKKDEIENLRQDRAAKLVKALESLEKSVNLKRDYSPAHFLSSQVYERQGNRALAIQKTIDTRNLNPLDTGVGYQLGLLYYLDNQIENARSEFERVISLKQDFSNARYFLGLSYDKLGSKAKAIEQFKKIQESNPDNEEVKRILANLGAGRDALSNIVPPATPPQQRIETPVEERGGESGETLAPAPTATPKPTPKANK